jgi:predicted N-acetyltransferase YhbS
MTHGRSERGRPNINLDRQTRWAWQRSAYMTERTCEFLHHRDDWELDLAPASGVCTATTIRRELKRDIAAREALLDAAFGAARFAKAAERLREDRLPAEKLSFIAAEGARVVGTVRLWNIMAGPKHPALLLGPLAVASDRRDRGIGARLIRHALRQAQRRGYRAILLVGDMPYYGRFGFTAEETGALWLPGRYEQHRLLGCELVPGALDGSRGLVSAAGRSQPISDRMGRVAVVAGRRLFSRRVRGEAPSDLLWGQPT